MLDMLKEEGVKTLEDVELYAAVDLAKKEEYKVETSCHNSKGLCRFKDLYKLVSYSHLVTFIRDLVY